MKPEFYFVVLLFFACNKGTDSERSISPSINFDFEVVDIDGDQIAEVGEKLIFSPTGQIEEATNFLWVFGNGDSCRVKDCEYTFYKKGIYRVDLWVDNKNRKERLVYVNETYLPVAMDTIVEIFGPDEAFVNEQIVFRAHGEGVEEWYWEFGEMEGIFSKDRQAQVIHQYKTPGRFTVKVSTNLSEYTVSHNIIIHPEFKIIPEDDPLVDPLPLVGDTIKWYLQEIANSSVKDSKTIKKYRNLIKNKYLCNLKKVVVVINGSRYNDFYSYCQGIHHLDSEENISLSIDDVKVDTIKCIERIEVTQSMQTPN